MRVIGVLTVLVSFLMLSCKTSEEILPNQTMCEGGEVLTLVDLTGFDGCSWVFETPTGKRLEPINLGSYLTEPKGINYLVKYKKRTDGASICMVGELIEITCIEPVN